jgi:hypothetical protein
VLQLGGGVAVLLPTASVIANGGLPSLAEGGLLAAVVGGTLVAGGTLSWYVERVVGELAWLPRSRALRVSTLTMWGERHDRRLSLEELERDGFAPPPPPPPAGGPGGELPEQAGFETLEVSSPMPPTRPHTASGERYERRVRAAPLRSSAARAT